MWNPLARLFGRKAASAPRPPDPPPLKSLDDLNALIDRSGLAAARDLILSRASPCLHMIAGGPAGEAPPGTTRLGGSPDLPVASAWPASERGACGFLGQFDLADVRARAGPTDLPAEGLLSVFVDFIDSAVDAAPVRAFLTPPGVPLERLPPPPEEDFGSHTGWLNPVSVAAFEPGISVPTSGVRLYDRIIAMAPDGDTDTFQDGLWPEPAGTIGQLLGSGLDLEGTDLRLVVHARRIGRPRLPDYDFVSTWEEWEDLKTIEQRLKGGRIYRPWTDAGDADVRFLLDHRDALEAEAGRLRLLVLITSNREMNLWINDADPIFVFIPAEGLARGDVSEVYGAVTQG